MVIKIKVIKCESQQWYSPLIGTQFDVIEYDNNRYAIAGDKDPKRIILKNDCEIMRTLEEPKEAISKRVLS